MSHYDLISDPSVLNLTVTTVSPNPREFTRTSKNGVTDGVECTYEDEPEEPEQRMKWLSTAR
jgi:hypothetical protein